MKDVIIHPYGQAPEEEEEEQKRKVRKDGLDEYHPYKCAFCGEESEVFVDGSATWLFDPGGSQRQLVSEECHSCCRRNLLTLIVDRDGDVTVLAERGPETA